MAVNCAAKSLSPSVYFESATTRPPAAVKARRKASARPTL